MIEVLVNRSVSNFSEGKGICVIGGRKESLNCEILTGNYRDRDLLQRNI